MEQHFLWVTTTAFLTLKKTYYIHKSTNQSNTIKLQVKLGLRSNGQMGQNLQLF